MSLLAALSKVKFSKEWQYSSMAVGLSPSHVLYKVISKLFHSGFPHLTPFSVQMSLLLHFFSASSFSVADQQ